MSYPIPIGRDNRAAEIERETAERRRRQARARIMHAAAPPDINPGVRSMPESDPQYEVFYKDENPSSGWIPISRTELMGRLEHRFHDISLVMRSIDDDARELDCGFAIYRRRAAGRQPR